MLKISRENLQYILVTGCFMPKWGEILTLILVFIIISRNTPSFRINKFFLLFFSLISTISIITIYLNSYSFYRFLQQSILVFTFPLMYYIILSNKNWETANLFEKYLNISYLVCLLGILQFVISFKTGIDIFFLKQSSGQLRISSIMGEPGGLAQITLPAVIYYFQEAVKNRCFFSKQALITILVFFMTLSVAAFLVIFIYIVHQFWLKFKYKKYLLFSLSIITVIIYFNLSGIFQTSSDSEEQNGNSLKLTETAKGIFILDPSFFELLNASSYATLSNLYVSLNSKSRIFGTGIGTHSESYKRVYQSDFSLYGLNMEDAYSLSIRVFSEMGIFGIILLLTFLYTNYNGSDNISVAICYLFLFVMIRGGHYTLFGLIFFATIYYLRKYNLNPSLIKKKNCSIC